MSVDREALHKEAMANLSEAAEHMRAAQRNLNLALVFLSIAVVGSVISIVLRLWL